MLFSLQPKLDFFDQLARNHLLLARFLERLGDQAVDVGEQVCFIVTGEVRELLPPKAARIPVDARRWS